MARATMIVMAAARPGEVEALDQWYDQRHVPDLLAVPGLQSIQRYDVRMMKTPAGCPKWDFMGVYELEAEDLDEVLGEMKARMGTERMPGSPSLDSSKTLSVLATRKGGDR